MTLRMIGDLDTKSTIAVQLAFARGARASGPPVFRRGVLRHVQCVTRAQVKESDSPRRVPPRWLAGWEASTPWRKSHPRTPQGACIDTIVKAINISLHKQKWSLLPLAKWM